MIDIIHIQKSPKLFEKSNYTAEERKIFHNFFRLKSNNTALKFIVRHTKKSSYIDSGELDHFQKGDEKKVLRENTPALITFLEACYELISSKTPHLLLFFTKQT